MSTQQEPIPPAQVQSPLLLAPHPIPSYLFTASYHQPCQLSTSCTISPPLAFLPPSTSTSRSTQRAVVDDIEHGVIEWVSSTAITPPIPPSGSHSNSCRGHQRSTRVGTSPGTAQVLFGILLTHHQRLRHGCDGVRPRAREGALAALEGTGCGCVAVRSRARQGAENCNRSADRLLAHGAGSSYLLARVYVEKVVLHARR